MIPADVASRLQVSADSALRPVAPAQEIADKLSGLIAGQKVMAEIQAMLPNGTYRAMINQRNVTLALPFSAKSGDALELLVTESDGKLALAVATRPDEGGKPAAASTSATLSRTGQLISNLLSETRDAKGGAATPLNANQPLSATPVSAQNLLPQLKQAITQSGMFYEAHQAEWVEGRFPQAALLQEPQGKLSSPNAFTTATIAMTAQEGRVAQPKAPVGAGEPAAALRLAADDVPTSEVSKTSSTQPSAAPGQVVAPQTQTLVQQQLEALATQNFSWQGQIWPGQEMRWEIDEDAARRDHGGDETAAKWATRLHLTLPNLGEIDAQLRLQGTQITLMMTAGNAETRALMRASSVALRSQLDEAGITLASLGVASLTAGKSDGQGRQ
ncbi:flagellar hook-length control protein FliK [Propionivibrio sp.]|uniref:flagellar hook-length control protein FliK n=1 Tax=Propionivibrio sp. TaxID=2212460 RepID=UPI002618929B|nr:flagellar hook-length control protein FliK [Propionivibrio sp.]